MKNESLYNKTVDILVKAYFDDTLRHGDCTACAVGNIVAGNNGYQIVESAEERPRWRTIDGDMLVYPAKNAGIPVGWGAVFCTECGHQEIELNNYFGEMKRQIDSTGYSVEELAAIEYNFEISKGHTKEDRMFNGLMAVIEVLDQIHENTDTNITQTSKQKFQKQLA